MIKKKSPHFISPGTIQFDLMAVNKEPNRFSAKQLDDYNRMELIRHIKDPELSKDIVKMVKELIKRAYPEQ